MADQTIRELSTNKIQLGEFIKYSPIWKDLKYELNAWLTDIRDQLENSDGNLSPRIMDRLGGNAETVRNVLALPEILLETLK